MENHYWMRILPIP